jgi:hypothetical protein
MDQVANLPAKQRTAPNLRARVLADTETVTGWVYAILRRILTCTFRRV